MEKQCQFSTIHHNWIAVGIIKLLDSPHRNKAILCVHAGF